MARPQYKTQNIERAHRWLVKAYDTVAEARSLLERGETRLGAYNRLYYSAHHAAVALLSLIGDSSKSHSSIKTNFSKKWVQGRGFPKLYGRLLRQLYEERRKADYGEYVSTLESDIQKRLRQVGQFIKLAVKKVPPMSFNEILQSMLGENPQIRDLSFDVYCPKSYYHHTRFTLWCPKGRLTDAWPKRALNASVRSLKSLDVQEAGEYVIGLNSRVNQYSEEHIVMLDFDNVSTIPSHRLAGEPGFLFRTGSGFHFIGLKLYRKSEWKKRMKKYSSVASKQHYDLSMKRGYATLRLTASPRKPSLPVYAGRLR